MDPTGTTDRRSASKASAPRTKVDSRAPFEVERVRLSTWMGGLTVHDSKLLSLLVVFCDVRTRGAPTSFVVSVLNADAFGT